MNARDLVTLNLNSQGGQKVVADLNRISAATAQLRMDNDKLRDSINKKRGEIEKTQKELNSYTSNIDKQKKIILGAVEANKSLRSKMAELEATTKKGSPEWQKLNNQINKNNTVISQNLEKINQLSASQSNAQKRLNNYTLENDRLQTSMKNNRASITQTNSEVNKYDKQITAVNKSTQSLTQKNNDLSAKMSDLEKANKSGSVAWQNANTQIAKNNSAISANNIEIQRLTSMRGDAQQRISTLRAEEDRLRQSFTQNKREISGVTKEVNGYEKTILNLNKTSAGLTAKNKELQASLSVLENTNKRNSPEWQKLNNQISENVNRMTLARTEMNRLSVSQSDARKRLADLRTENKGYQNQLDKNNRAIAENKEAYNRAAMSIKTTEMSYNQLSKRQSELRRELNSTSKSLFPDKWNALNKQLTDVEKQMGKVAAGSQGVSNKFGNLGQTITKVLALMVTYAVVRFFQDLAMAAVNFVKEGIQMAAIAEGVRNAFVKLNQPDLLVNLRKETKGLINDFLLMQSAVKADKFNIPVEKLGSLLKFAQQRAQETGDSVDYLVTSIINGIGRKSSLILDNLGISATRLQKEVGEAGDFTQGVIKIVNEELEKQGNLALTSAEKAQQSAVKWQNAQLMVGNSLKWLKDKFSDMSGAIADAFVGLLDSSKATALTETFLKIKSAVVAITGSVLTYIGVIKLVSVATTRWTFITTLHYRALQAQNAIMIVLRGTLYALQVAYFTLTGQVAKARGAMLAFAAVTGLTNPMVILTAVVAALAAGIYLWSRNAKEAVTTAKMLNDITKDAQKSISEEKTELELLLRVAKNEKISKEERLKAIKRLNEISPEYLGNLSLENINTQAATRSVEAYTRALLKNAKVKSIEGKVNTEEEKRIDNLLKIEEKTKLINNLRKEINDAKIPSVIATKKNELSLEQSILDRLKEENAQIDANIKTYTSFFDDIFEVQDRNAQKSAPILELELKKEREKLAVLEAQQAAKMYPSMVEPKNSNPFSSVPSFAEKATNELLNQQVDAQRKLVDEKQKALDLSREVVIGETDIIKKLEAQLEITKKMPGGTDEQVKERNIAVKSIEDQIKYYKELGIEKEKGTGNKYISKQRKEMMKDLLALENANKQRINDLSENKTNEEQYKQDIIASDKKYYQDRINYLTDFSAKVKDPKLSEDVNKDLADTNAKLIETNNNLDQARLSSLNKAYEKEYQYAELSRNAQIRLLQEKNLSEEEYAAGLEYIDLVYSDRRLAIQRQFGEDLAYLELSNSELKEKAVIESNEAIVQSEIDTYNRRRDINLNARDNNVQVRDQYNISTPEERKKREIQALDDLYAAKQISAETHEKALQAIDLKYEQERIQIRDQYGITSIWERYDAEKDILAQQYAENLLTEEEHQKALNQLKLKYAIESAQTVASIAGTATDAVSALQQAETDNLDAEYDTRIAAAEGNAAEVERLENEKAQKKLDIEKKYADVQFAVRAAEIIANTAVAIMQGYAQLGPIGGSIAAAFLGLTGAAQLASANAERQKVKNMTIKGTNSAASTGERFMLPGKEEGGSIDVTRSQDGKNFTAAYQPGKRGYVSRPTVIVGEGSAGQSREWVASNGAVSNPTIRPIIDLIDHEQRRGTVRTVDMNQRIRQRMAGFETGGFINQAATSPANNQPVVVDRGVDPLMVEMYQFLKQLRADGIPAIVGLDELDARQNYKNSITQNYIRP